MPEIVREHGGVPLRTRVGHSFIKAEMARTGAVFGGEHSAHYYFHDFWCADTGMLAAMHVLAALGEQTRPLSTLTAHYHATRHPARSTRRWPTPMRRRSEPKRYGRRSPDARPAPTTWTGSTVELADGTWFNVRASNTEPLLRLNVEGPDVEAMSQVRDEALAMIRAASHPTGVSDHAYRP